MVDTIDGFDMILCLQSLPEQMRKRRSERINPPFIIFRNLVIPWTVTPSSSPYRPSSEHYLHATPEKP